MSSAANKMGPTGRAAASRETNAVAAARCAQAALNVLSHTPDSVLLQRGLRPSCIRAPSKACCAGPAGHFRVPVLLVLPECQVLAPGLAARALTGGCAGPLQGCAWCCAPCPQCATWFGCDCTAGEAALPSSRGPCSGTRAVTQLLRALCMRQWLSAAAGVAAGAGAGA